MKYHTHAKFYSQDLTGLGFMEEDPLETSVNLWYSGLSSSIESGYWPKIG